MSMELPVPGILESPFGVFESKIFSYKKQKIEEKKYTKWFDYDKIKIVHAFGPEDREIILL